MAKLLYRKDFLRLLRASESAEKGYAAFLRDTFQYPSSMSLEDMLKDIFGGAADKSTEQRKLMEQINAFGSKPFNELLYQGLIDKFTELFQDSKRLDRTVKALTEILSIGQNKKKGDQADINKLIRFVVGNYKEDFFLKTGGEQYVSKSRKKSRGLLGITARFLDVDTVQCDFILAEGLQDPTLKQYGNASNKKNSPIAYIQGGIPLEYKATLTPQFHWFDKTYDNINLNNIIKNHVRAKNTQWEEDYNNIIIDITMKAIFEKINNGFPVFVTRTLYKNEDSFILCSTVLKSISTLAGLQDLVIEQSSYGGLTKMRNLSKEQILQIIKTDREARSYIEHQIKDLKSSGLYGEDELTRKIFDLKTEEEAINLLKSIIKQEQINLSIFYGKRK